MFGIHYVYFCDFPGGSDGKASAYNVGDPGLIPRSGRSPGEGNGNPVQYSRLENPMDRGTSQAENPWGRKECLFLEFFQFSRHLSGVQTREE